MLVAYGGLSLILFDSSPGFQKVVAAFPDGFPWLADVFPALRKVPQTLTLRSSSFSVGYIYHLYFVALVVFFAMLAVHVVHFRSIQIGMLIRTSRDASYRKRFDDPVAAFCKISLALLFILLMLVTVSAGWLWSPTSRRLYAWHSFRWPLFEWPLTYGALPAMVLIGLQGLVFAASKRALEVRWGVDAAREEGEINESGRSRDPR